MVNKAPEGSWSCQTVKLCNVSRGTRNQESLLARAGSNLAVSQPVKLVSCESVASQQGHGHGTRALFIIRSRYQAMTSEYIEDLMCAIVTVIFIECEN
jgi:hypothetical protein